MAEDDQSVASIAARLRAQIRADLVASLTPVAPAPAPRAPTTTATAPAAKGVAAPDRIVGTDGRPDVLLPDTSTVKLEIPAVVTRGLSVAYKAGDSTHKADGTGSGGVGFALANVTTAGGHVVGLDVRRFFTPEPPSTRSQSIGSTAVMGNEAGAGVFWIHPTLLDLASGEKAVKQLDGVTVTRVPFDLDDVHFKAVRIAQTAPKSTATFHYDQDTGLLLSMTIRVQELLSSSDMLLTYLSRREVKVPWANHPVPDWVAKTRKLAYDGTKTMTMSGLSVRQTLKIDADLETFGPDVVLASVTTLIDSGNGLPADRSETKMLSTPAMLYPLWIAPAALQALKPGQVIDDDPVTRFVMTFSGIEGQRAALQEEGALERTTYYFSISDGRFQGFHAERPIAGGTLVTDTWLRG